MKFSRCQHFYFNDVVVACSLAGDLKTNKCGVASQRAYDELIRAIGVELVFVLVTISMNENV